MSETTVVVRQERAGEAEAARGVHIACFPVPEGEVQSVESVLLDWLREDGDLRPDLTFIAVRGAEAIGHVACSRATLDGDRPSVGVGPLAVCPDDRRTGVGADLMRAVIAAADGMGEKCLVLLGDPDYYGRFGFEPASRRGITPPQPWQDANFQVRVLSAWEDGDGGAFRYAPAFERLTS